MYVNAEEWLARYPLDEKALRAFRDLSETVQQQVMRKGSLDDARDPNAVLTARIRKMRNGEQPGMQGGAQGMGGGGLLQGMDGGGLIHGMTGDGMCAGTGAPVSAPTPIGIRDDWFCHGCGDTQRKTNPICRRCGSPKPVGGAETAPIDAVAWLSKFNVEERAWTAFRELSDTLQQYVIRRGTLADARDPTALLLARIRKALNGEDGASGFGTQPHMQTIGSSGMAQGGGTVNPEEWLSNYPLDDRALNLFRELPENIQQQVIRKGSLVDARDPNAVLTSRVRKVCAEYGFEPPTQPRMQAKSHSMGGSGMTQGTAHAGTMQGRIRGPSAEEGPGWNCPCCNDLQAPRNMFCRSCGTPKSAGGGGCMGGADANSGCGMGACGGGDCMDAYGGGGCMGTCCGSGCRGGYGVGGGGFMGACGDGSGGGMGGYLTDGDTRDPAIWVQQFGVDQQTMEQFMMLPLSMQQSCMSQGPLNVDGNPAGLLWNRMKPLMTGFEV